ncbi:hypothetical protein BJI47_10560 [Rhodococcus sp. 1168]|nr:hypothetical protein BJI47_10560 [Rhodococcus sp. 1168]
MAAGMRASPRSETQGCAADRLDHDESSRLREEPSWITVFHEDGSTEMVERVDLEQRRLARSEPIEQVAGFNGGQTLAEFDRDLVVGLLATDAVTARRIAVYCANAACEHAGLADLPWVRPALDVLAENRTPPAPFADIGPINDAFAPRRLRARQSSVLGRRLRSMAEASPGS